MASQVSGLGKVTVESKGHLSGSRAFKQKEMDLKEKAGQENLGKALNDISGGALEDPAAKEMVKRQELGKNEFMKLLLAQIKNQDPLKPMDGREMTTQMAQLSSLEQLVNLNTNVEKMNEATTESLLQGSHLIGKMVESRSNSIDLKKDQNTKFNVNLKTPVQRLEVKIYDLEGKLLRTLEQGAKEKGDHTVSWDGKTSEGDHARPGEYNYTVSAVDDKGKSIDIKNTRGGVVTGVEIFKNRPVVRVGEDKIFMDDVKKIYSSDNPTPVEIPDTQKKSTVPAPPVNPVVTPVPIVSKAVTTPKASESVKKTSDQENSGSSENKKIENPLYMPLSG